MAFQGEGIDALCSVYRKAQKEASNGHYPLRGQRPLEGLYMTDLLQGIIDSGFPVHPVNIHRGWLEIDSLSDLELGEQSIRTDNGKLTVTQ